MTAETVFSAIILYNICLLYLLGRYYFVCFSSYVVPFPLGVN